MPLTATELEPLLRLSLVQGIGPHRLSLLIHRFGSAEAVIRARPSDLERIPGMGGELAGRVRAASSAASRAGTSRALRHLERLNAVALTQDDPVYPAAFHDLSDRPYLLFATGDLSLLQRPALAIVGTRAPTPYGRNAAESLSGELALAGLVIVSGMARGIDAAAHRGAMEAGGSTVGVLGHGIEQVYPPEAGKLFQRVREQGLIITEYPPGETPRAGNFPRRNRLIMALSRAVLVVEMGFRSGAQHTIGYAIEQGKEVLAVPGPIGSLASEGTNQLIKEGARMVTSALDVVEELFGVGWEDSAEARNGASLPIAAQTSPAPALPLLSDREARVLAALGPTAVYVDEIASVAGLEAADALVLLLDLELRGLVSAAPGMRYTRR